MIKDLTSKLISIIGENPNREGLKKTPDRVEKSWKFLTQGYKQDIKKVVNGALFKEKYDFEADNVEMTIIGKCKKHTK